MVVKDGIFVEALCLRIFVPYILRVELLVLVSDEISQLLSYICGMVVNEEVFIYDF